MRSFEAYLKEQSFGSKSIARRMLVIKMYWQWLKKENLEAEEVNYNDLMLYMKQEGRRGITQRTIQSYMGVIKHYYEYLLQEGKIDLNPATDIAIKGVKRKTLYTPIQTHELHRIYHAFPDLSLKDQRNKVMLGLLIYQALRTEELAKLEVGDVNLKEGVIDVKGSRKSNGRKMRLESHQVMGMYNYTLQVRSELLQLKPKRNYQKRKETDRLFIGDGGSTRHFSNYITQLMIKVKEINPHIINAKQLRALVITKWLKMYNLREVQYLAGHRYISSTESYLENDIEGLQEEVQQYHPLG